MLCIGINFEHGMSFSRTTEELGSEDLEEIKRLMAEVFREHLDEIIIINNDSVEHVITNE